MVESELADLLRKRGNGPSEPSREQHSSVDHFDEAQDRGWQQFRRFGAGGVHQHAGRFGARAGERDERIALLLYRSWEIFEKRFLRIGTLS